MNDTDFDTLLRLLDKLERTSTVDIIKRLARSLFQKINRARYSDTLGTTAD